MQFDSALNTGLYITNDIDAQSGVAGTASMTVAARLPRSALSIEVWFTLEKERVLEAGLAGVFQEGHGCALGWSITYHQQREISGGQLEGRHMTTYLFKMALPKVYDSSKRDSGVMLPVFVEVQLVVETNLHVWTHLVATYNGSHLILFLDGVEKAVEKACNQPPCGDIMYSANQKDEFSTLNTCKIGRTAFTIGRTENSFSDIGMPHIGLLKHLRILNLPIQAGGSAMLYQRFAARLNFSALSDFEYWVKASALRGALTRSPSIDMVDAETQDWVTVRGNFSTAQEYRCKFTFANDYMTSQAVMRQLECSNLAEGETCLASFADTVDTISCKTPKWRLGFKATTFSIEKRLDLKKTIPDYNCNRTCEEALLNTSAATTSDCLLKCNRSDAVYQWKPLLQRVCVKASCGYKSPLQRKSAQYWYTEGNESLLSSALGGGFSYIRTLTPGAIYKIDKRTQRLARVSTFMTGMSDAWGAPLRNRYVAAGVSRYTHTTLHGEHYLLGATAWNGKETHTTSGLYHFNESSKTLNLLQEVDTFGARNWIFFNANNTTFAAVSNYHGPSAVYRCRGGLKQDNNSDSRAFMLMLDLSTVLELDIRAASSMTAFSIQDSQYLLVSTFFDGLTPQRASPSVLYKVIAGAQGSIAAQIIQELSVGCASDVIHFQHAGFVSVIFAVNNETSPSLIFSANLSEPPPMGPLELLRCCQVFAATVPTKQASSVRVFEAIGSLWLTVTEETDTHLADFLDDSQVGSKVMRCNGTHFIGRSSSRTSPRDAASGQLLNFTRNTQLVYVRTGESALLLAGNFLNGDGGANVLQVLPAVVSSIERLVRPASVAISPVDGKYVYVAASGSQSIAVFERDVQSGQLRPSSVLMRSENLSATELGDMPAFRSIQRLAISPDQRHLYATLMMQNTIVTMDIAPASGALRVSSKVTNGDLSADGDKVDCLLSAFGIHVSADGAIVYVTAYFEGALAAFARNSTDGTLSLLDVERDGQRIFEDFQDLSLDTNARANDSLTSTPIYPRTMPFGQVSAPPRAIKYFAFGGRSFLAVASTSTNWDIADGALTVFEWVASGNATGQPNLI